jgi:hypothetical protein
MQICRSYDTFFFVEIVIHFVKRMPAENNLAKLNKLLEEGFLIEQISYNIRKGIFTTTVNLSKGAVREKIVSVDEEDFLDYIKHFKQVGDGYGNFVFMFIENLAEYEKKRKQLPEYVGARDIHYVEVGERRLDKDITITVLQKPSPGVQLARACFFVKPSSNPEFQKIDLRDQVTIYDKNTNEVVYKGYINYLVHGRGVVYFECELGPRMLTVSKINAEFIGFRPFDAIYFVTRKSGVTLRLPPKVEINLSPRDFIVIVPIFDLIIKDAFRFADVEFYSAFNSKDDHIIRKSNMARRTPDWSSNFPRAKIIVRAPSHFDAIEIGHSKIRNVLNWFSLRNDLTFPVIEEIGKNSNVGFNYFKYYSRVRLSTMVYCREMGTNHVCLVDKRALVGNILSIEYDPNEYFKPTKRLFEPLISKSRDDLVQEEKNILRSLHWLAKSIQEENNIDQLLDLWTSLEFIVSRTKGKLFFDGNEKKKILSKIKELTLQEKQLEILENKIAMLNDAPLMEKVRLFIERHKLDFRDGEWKLLQKMRRKRNDIIHGKRESDVSNQEIEKLRGMIDRILLANVNATLKELVS